MRYADTNFILLGLVIKSIFGASVQEVATKEIFDQMPLINTTFTPNKSECVPTAIINDQVLQGIPHDPKARQLGLDCGSSRSIFKYARFNYFQSRLSRSKKKYPSLQSRHC